MADNFIDIEGFEKYGPIPNGATFTNVTGNFSVSNVGYTPLVNQGFLQEWVTIGGNPNLRNTGLIQGLSGNGIAFLIESTSTTNFIAVKSLGDNYSRIIIGFACMVNLVGNCGIILRDAGTNKVSLFIDSSGRVNFSRGGIPGTILYTSSSLILSNTRHYLELDITIHGSTGHYQIWLDGVSLTNSNNSQNTNPSGNNYINQTVLDTTSTPSVKIAFDDMYWRDNLNGTAIPCGDCRVEGKKVVGDYSTTFMKEKSVLGIWYEQQVSNINAPGISLVLVPTIPEVNMVVNSIGLIPKVTNGSVKNKGVVYSDSGGNPSSLLSDGIEVIGFVNGNAQTLPLVTPQNLISGIQYWIGYYTDTSLNIGVSNNWQTVGQKKTNTYASGAPSGPLSGMTTGQNPWCIWGNCSGSASGFANVNNQTPPLMDSGLVSLEYNSSSEIGNQDLFEVENLNVTPNKIYAVKLSGLIGKSDTGPRTADLRLLSNTTTSSGNDFGFVPGTTMSWYFSIYESDPDTGVDWTQSGINGIKAGYKVVG